MFENICRSPRSIAGAVTRIRLMSSGLQRAGGKSGLTEQDRSSVSGEMCFLCPFASERNGYRGSCPGAKRRSAADTVRVVYMF